MQFDAEHLNALVVVKSPPGSGGGGSFSAYIGRVGRLVSMDEGAQTGRVNFDRDEMSVPLSWLELAANPGEQPVVPSAPVSDR